MKVFVTGATGNVGTPLVPILVSQGHTVTGLCRSEKSAETLKKAGGTPVMGDITNLDVIAKAAREADAVIHLAFNHELMMQGKPEEATTQDLTVVKAIGDALKGSGKLFIGTSGTLDFTRPNFDRVYDDTEAKTQPVGRGINEQTLLDFNKESVKAISMRLPSFVYGNNIWGFVTVAIDGAKKAGKAFYIGEGAGRFNSTHVEDVANAYALALTKGQPGIYNVVDDNTRTYKDLATAVGKILNVETASLPADAAAKAMGPWMTFAFSSNNPSSSSKAAKDLGWVPTKKTNIIDDVLTGSYKVRASN